MLIKFENYDKYLEDTKFQRAWIPSLYSPQIKAISLKGLFIAIPDYKELLQAIFNNSSIKNLDLMNNVLTLEQNQTKRFTWEAHISYLTLSMSNLTSLTLSGCILSAKEIRSFSKTLQCNTSLTSLNMSCNYMKDEGLKYISAALYCNNTITHLDISGNAISKEGVVYISQALKINTSIANLDFSCNHVGENGAKYFASLFECNTTLKSVNLEYNRIPINGILHCLNSLKSNITLTYLGLQENIVYEKDVKKILEIVPSLCPSLTIKLGRNLGYAEQFISAQTKHIEGCEIIL